MTKMRNFAACAITFVFLFSSCTATFKRFNIYDIFPTCRATANQGICGCSWADIVAHSVSVLACTNDPARKLTLLSPQTMINCVAKNANGNFCPTFYNTDFLIDSLDWAKTKGLKTIMKDTYMSRVTGLVGDCDSSSGTVKLSSYTQIGSTSLDSVSPILMMGAPVIGLVRVHPTFYFAKENQNIYRRDGDTIDYGLLAVTVYGWETDAQGKVWYRVDTSLGDSWGNHGQGLIEVKSLVVAYELKLQMD